MLVDTGEVPGSHQYIVAPEFAAVLGSWTVQAEWAGQFFTHAVPNNQPQGTVFYNGGYAEVLYFLTGEIQAYDKSTKASSAGSSRGATTTSSRATVAAASGRGNSACGSATST